MEDRPPDAPGPSIPPPPAYPPPPPPPGGPAVRPPIPWEDRARPKASAFFETIKLLYTRTREAYERMPVTGDVLQPYLFAILVGWIGIAVSTMWQMTLRGMMHSILSAMGQGGSEDYRFIGNFFTGPLVIVCAPAIVAVAVLLGALVYQLFLMILGGARSGFAATLRVVCYAQAATLLQIIPGCGSLVGGILQLVFTVIGFSAAHRISTGKATAAVLLPVVLCCVCLAIAFAIGGAAAIGAFRQGLGR